VTESGIDVTDGGACEVTLVMSAGGGQLEGQVANADSQPAPFAQVTLVPTGSRRSDLFKSVTTDARGHFTIGGIAPGAYQAHAWEEVDINAVRYDQDFVKPYESFAQAVRFDEGGRQTIALKRIR
jgi:hypothetical protein